MSDEFWQRQPGESSRWYSRFEVYRLLGPKRTIEGAFKLAKETEGFGAQRPGAGWLQAAKRWQWQERAEAWDEGERQRFLQQEENRRIDARRRRLAMIEAAQEQAYAALRRPHWPTWMPATRRCRRRSGAAGHHPHAPLRGAQGRTAGVWREYGNRGRRRDPLHRRRDGRCNGRGGSMAQAESERTEWLKCSLDPAYFLDHYGWIYDATAKRWLRFELWPAQIQLLDLLLVRRLLVILKARHWA